MAGSAEKFIETLTFIVEVSWATWCLSKALALCVGRYSNGKAETCVLLLPDEADGGTGGGGETRVDVVDSFVLLVILPTTGSVL